jgi:hypothetical protein
VTPEARVVAQRAFGDLYRHMREHHGYAAGVLARARNLRDLQQLHDDLDPECELER